MPMQLFLSANISCATDLTADGALGLEHPAIPHMQGVQHKLAQIILAAWPHYSNVKQQDLNYKDFK